MKKLLTSMLLMVLLAGMFSFAMAEEIVLVDNKNCCFKVRSMEREGDDYVLKVYAENRSERAASFLAEDGVINGYAVDVIYLCLLPGGKKANGEIRFRGLAASGVTDEVNKVEFDIHGFDVDDMYYLMDDPMEEHFVLYPLGEDAEKVDEREAQDTDILIVDKDGVTVTLTGYRQDDLLGTVADLYVVNKTDADVVVAFDQESINGYMVNAFWSEKIPANSRKYTYTYWDNTILKENEIEKIEQIELRAYAYSCLYWHDGNIFDKVIVLEP